MRRLSPRRAKLVICCYAFIFFSFGLPALATTRNVQSYGATGNGTSDDTSAIEAAIGALQKGDTLLFPCGTYLVSSSLHMSISNVTVDGSSCAVVHNASGSGGAPIMVVGNGGIGSSNSGLGSAIALSGIATELTTTFSTASSLGVSAGSYVYLYQGGIDGSPSSTATSCDTTGCQGEILQVQSASGNSVTVTTALHDTYNPSANAAVAQALISPLTGITLQNITFDGSGSTLDYGVQVNGVVNSTIKGVSAHNFLGAAISSNGGFNNSWSNITVSNAGSENCGAAVNFSHQGNLSVSGMSISQLNTGSSSCLGTGGFGFEMATSANGVISNFTVDATGTIGRPFKLTAARYNTFNSLAVKNASGVYNGMSLEYYSSHNIFNSCVVSNNGAGTGSGTGNAGINSFGNFNQYNTFNNCSVTGNGNVQIYISNYDGLRLGQDIGDQIIGGTYSGSNSSEPPILIAGANTSVSGATIKGPGPQGVNLTAAQSTGACINNNIFSSGTGLMAAIVSSSNTNLGSGNTMNGLSSNLQSGTCGGGNAAPVAPTGLTASVE